MNISASQPRHLDGARTVRQPHLPLQASQDLAASVGGALAEDAVELAAAPPAEEVAAPSLSLKHALGFGFLAAASLCGAAAGYLAGSHAAPQASTSVSVPARAASSTVSTAGSAQAAGQRAQITQAATAAVGEAVTSAAQQIAQSHPNQPINIQIRDINVFVVGFDDFIDATQNHAPEAPAQPGQPTQPGQPAGGDGGGEEIRRRIEIRHGETVLEATEHLKPAPAAPQAPAPRSR